MELFKKIVFLVLTLAMLVVSLPCVAAVWTEVEVISGNADTKQSFTVNNENWRIRWQYSPKYIDTIGAQYAYFGVIVSDSNGLVDTFAMHGDSIISGSREYSGSGVYEISTFPANLVNYRITIEQETIGAADNPPTDATLTGNTDGGIIVVVLIIAVILGLVVTVVGLIVLVIKRGRKLSPTVQQ